MVTLNFKLRSLIILLLLAVNTVSVWSYSTGSVTDFYYYKNKPFYLNIRNSKLFIKSKEVLSENAFRQITGQYFQISQQSKFDIGIKEQFIDLVSNYNSTNLNEIVSALKNNSQIDLASVVYSPPENDKVLQGLEDQCIAQFKPYMTSSQINDFLNARGLSIVSQLEISGGATYILQIPKSVNITTIETANSLYESGFVNFCDPDFYYIGLLAFIPNDTFFGMQWSLRNLGNNIPGGIPGTPGCDMKVDSAWNNTLGNSHCIIGMVDTGIDTTHPDIIGNMTHGKNWDFINAHAGCYDDQGHGTCTAGIVAATGNNNLGISGVCPNAKLIGIKILNSSGATTTAALTKGLIWSWTQGEWISSNSWHGVSPVSAADQTIIDGTNLGRNGKGTIFCFAAGNNNGAILWPASNPNVIAVGGNSPCNQRKSPTSCDNLSWGACFGTGLSVVTPCVDIYTTDRQGTAGYDPGDYFATFDGTSSAAPNCAGVVALGLSCDSTLKWDTVRSRLCWTADKVGAYAYTSDGPYSMLSATWNNEMGYGKVNANRFVRAILFPVIPLAHNISVGPFLSIPQGYLLVNTNYNIKTRLVNIGSNNETAIPVKFFVNGTLISITNINLTANQTDSVNNVWTASVPGTYNLMYVSGLGTDLDRNNDTVRTTINILSSLPDLCEDFILTVFPPAGWTETFSGTNYWSRSTVSRVGSGSLLYNIWNAPDGTVQSMYTPTFPATVADDSLVFVEAYQPFASSPDSLVIYTSINGGTSWAPLARYGITQLQTTSGNSEPFVPTASQWATRKVGPLPVGTNKLQFYGRSGLGDNLYLDSICLIQHLTNINHNENEIPNVYSLLQNYPNPFNPSTTISYGLPKAGFVKLMIYDILGREVKTLVNEYKEAGIYNIVFDASGISSGVYFYKVEVSQAGSSKGDFTSIKKMVLLK